MAVLGIASPLLPSVANLALAAILINEAKVALDRTYEFAAFEVEDAGAGELHELRHLSVRDLGFRFAGRGQRLKGIDLDFSKGKLVALIDESGCGKSTLE